MSLAFSLILDFKLKFSTFAIAIFFLHLKIFTMSLRMEVAPPKCLQAPLEVPDKLLMGPGPSNCSPRVLEACSLPVLGHMHQEFFKILDDIKAGLQYVFQTKNEYTFAISGPGHLGMEAVLANLLEPGDGIVVGVNGLWGERASITAERIGANVHRLRKPLGTTFSRNEIAKALEKTRPKALFLVHSESSTGVMQNLEGIGDLCRSYDCLLLVDTVASLGGVPFFMDKWKVDATYTGSQKVIGAPPGMAPVSFSKRAMDAFKARTTPPKSYLLDLDLLGNYWSCNGDGAPRVYHHTPPVTLLYGLREALAQVAEEKLENMWARHRRATQQLYDGLRLMGIEFFIENEAERLPTVTTIKVPPGVRDWKIVPKFANDKNLTEIAGGIGPTVGKIFRFGVMGYNATPEKVDRLLRVFREGVELAKTKSRL